MKKLFLLVGLVVFLTPTFTYGLDNEFNIDSLIDELNIEVEKERKEKEKQNILKKKQIEERKKEEYLKKQQQLFEKKQLEEKKKKELEKSKKIEKIKSEESLTSMLFSGTNDQVFFNCECKKLNTKGEYARSQNPICTHEIFILDKLLMQFIARNTPIEIIENFNERLRAKRIFENKDYSVSATFDVMNLNGDLWVKEKGQLLIMDETWIKKDYQCEIMTNEQIASNPRTDFKKFKTKERGDLREKLITLKNLFDEELISKEDYDQKRKDLLSSLTTTSTSSSTSQTTSDDLTRAQEELNIEKQKLEEMKRQTKIAREDLEEQKKIAEEAKRRTRIERQRENQKLMRKGLCLLNTGSFLAC